MQIKTVEQALRRRIMQLRAWRDAGIRSIAGTRLRTTRAECVIVCASLNFVSVLTLFVTEQDLRTGKQRPLAASLSAAAAAVAPSIARSSTRGPKPVGRPPSAAAAAGATPMPDGVCRVRAADVVLRTVCYLYSLQTPSTRPDTAASGQAPVGSGAAGQLRHALLPARRQSARCECDGDRAAGRAGSRCAAPCANAAAVPAHQGPAGGGILPSGLPQARNGTVNRKINAVVCIVCSSGSWSDSVVAQTSTRRAVCTISLWPRAGSTRTPPSSSRPYRRRRRRHSHSHSRRAQLRHPRRQSQRGQHPAAAPPLRCRARAAPTLRQPPLSPVPRAQRRQQARRQRLRRRPRRPLRQQPHRWMVLRPRDRP